jgi:hypothetical protein
VLADYKRWYVQSESSLELVDSALGLLGIGLRHRGAMAEVRKALARENRAAVEGRPTAATIPQIQSIVEELTELVFDRPKDCARLHIALGRTYATKKTEDAGELPEDIARLLAANSPATFLSSREGLALLFACLPWTSRARRRTFTGRRNTWTRSAMRGTPSTLPVCFETRRWHSQQPSRYGSRRPPAATSHVRVARARSTSVATGSEIDIWRRPERDPARFQSSAGRRHGHPAGLVDDRSTLAARQLPQALAAPTAVHCAWDRGSVRS